MLLSGVDTHRNGLQHGTVDRAQSAGIVGYEGFWNDRVATLPQLMKEAGYHTTWSASGTWARRPTRSLRPRVRADFSLLDGAGSYWDMTNFTAAAPKSVFTEDGRYLTKLPDDYYATRPTPTS